MLLRFVAVAGGLHGGRELATGIQRSVSLECALRGECALPASEFPRIPSRSVFSIGAQI